MKKLIICKNPGFARFIMSCINEKFEAYTSYNSSYPTYFESENFYVSYARGNLFEAYDIEDYTKEAGEWNLEALPFFPENNKFYFKLKQIKKDGKKETDSFSKIQYKTIFNLIKSEKTIGIIHCGDASCEGEIVIRQIISNCSTNKPVERLWLKSNTREAFNEAFFNMKMDSEYDKYANEGWARLKLDYLYSKNMTRYLSLKTKAPKSKPMQIGLVSGGMLNEIYKREIEIENFIPENYYSLISEENTNGKLVRLCASDIFNEDEYEKAIEQCGLYNQAGAYVKDILREEKNVNPEKLFSLSSLQNVLSNQCKMSLEHSMDVIYQLFEAGYITYPRTNTEYLSENEKKNVSRLIELFNEEGYDLLINNNNEYIFDDSKIDIHSAIYPTTKKGDGLKGEQKEVYDIIRNRFLAVFCREECIEEQSTMIVQCIDKEYKLLGKKIVQQGFLKYETQKTNDTSLPDIEIGAKVIVNFMPYKENTEPPQRYSVAAFNNLLETPFARKKGKCTDKYEEITKGVEIGTVSSRTLNIANMIRNGYIEEKNQLYYLKPLGKYVIESLNALGITITKEKNAEVSHLLKQIFNGTLTENEVLEIVKEDIMDMFINKDLDIPDCISEGVLSKSGFTGSPVGNCPICGENVYETDNGYVCENHEECFFQLVKEDKYIRKISGQELKSSWVSILLKKGYIYIPAKSSKGAEYEIKARIKMTSESKIIWENVVYIGKCPICGGNVKITPFGYICENNNTDGECFFILYRNDRFIQAYLKKELDNKTVEKLLKKNYIVESIEKKNNSGKYKLKFFLNIDHLEKKIQWEKEYEK